MLKTQSNQAAKLVGYKNKFRFGNVSVECDLAHECISIFPRDGFQNNRINCMDGGVFHRIIAVCVFF